METKILKSDKDNEFIFHSGMIVDTELTLVIFDPSKRANVLSLIDGAFDFVSTTIKVVTEDGSPCDVPVNFDNPISMTDSKFEGTLSIFNSLTLRDESTIKRLDARFCSEIIINSGDSIQSFHDYRYSDCHLPLSYGKFVNYATVIEGIENIKVPVLHCRESYRTLNRYMQKLKAKQSVRLHLDFDCSNGTPQNTI